MTDCTDAAEQLHDEVLGGLAALAPFIGLNEPAGIWARCQVAVAELGQEDDDRLAAEACISVMGALWPHAAPEAQGRADWWRTPLGALCARSLGRSDAESISYSVAASMLGVAKGTVSTLISRGTLDRHPDGGVLRASVLQRLGR